jgi:hypothetical protein
VQMWARASPVRVPMWQGAAQSQCRCGRGEPSPQCRCGRLSPAGVAAAAVPERSVHVLSVQLAVQLHSNEPIAIDSTSPARRKSSRYPPLSKSVRDLAIEPAAGARCPIGCAARYYGNAVTRRVQHAAYAACACLAVRERDGVCVWEHAHVHAWACVRVCAYAHRDGGTCGDGRFPMSALAGIGISRNRDIPIKDLGSSETESFALP